MNTITMSMTITLLLYCFETQAAPELLWFNSGVNNRDVTFSPDETVMLSTITAPKNNHAVIVVSYLHDGQWTEPMVAPFSGDHPDIEPAFAPDGLSLYFASRRPKPDRDGADWDLWQVPFIAGQWGEPEHLGDVVNTEGDEYYPSVTNTQVLYWTATRSDTLGTEDLYRSKRVDGQYQQVENVGEPVNSKAYEFNAFIAPDESYLIFGAQRRPGETGGGDIYISHRKGGVFQTPQLLSEEVNTNRLDYCPSVHGDYFYFTSERLQDRTIATMQDMKDLYQQPGNGFGDVYRIPLREILNQD